MLDAIATHYIPECMPKKVVPDSKRPGHSAPCPDRAEFSISSINHLQPRTAEVHLRLGPPHCLWTAISRSPKGSRFVSDSVCMHMCTCVRMFVCVIA